MIHMIVIRYVIGLHNWKVHMTCYFICPLEMEGRHKDLCTLYMW